MESSLAQDAWLSSRSSLVSAWRTGNTSLDSVFYDTEALSTKERNQLSSHVDPQGLILVVYPAKAHQPIKTLTALDFVREQEAGPSVRAVAVAGVGSSALGTASLARDVADYLGAPVAGIVSGLGLADVLTEALGGWFIFGTANAIRDEWAHTLDLYVPDHVRDQKTHEAIKRHFKERGISPEFLYGSPDSTALLYLLSKLGSQIKLLVGHSKGNYSIENALEGLLEESESSGAVPRQLKIVTLGAVIWFPPEFKDVHQFIGQADWFGMLNSRPNLNCVVVPGRWHSTNKMLPGHMSVAQALKLAGVGPAR